MPQTALPNIGLNYDWDLGSDGWKDGVDGNFVALDALGGQARILGVLTAEPASPAVGDAYILSGSPTGTNWGSDTGAAADAIALYTNVSGQPDGSPWAYLTPREGWRVYDRAANVWRFFDGSAWLVPGSVRETTAAAVTVTAADAGGVIALDNASPASLLIDDEANQTYPIGGETLIVNRNAAAADITDGAAVTWLGPDPTGSAVLAQGAFLRIRKTGSDEWIDVS